MHSLDLKQPLNLLYISNIHSPLYFKSAGNLGILKNVFILNLQEKPHAVIIRGFICIYSLYVYIYVYIHLYVYILQIT